MSRGGPAPAGAAEAGVDGDPDDDAGFSAAQTNLFKLVSMFSFPFSWSQPTSISHAKCRHLSMQLSLTPTQLDASISSMACLHRRLIVDPMVVCLWHVFAPAFRVCVCFVRRVDEFCESQVCFCGRNEAAGK